MNTIDCALDSGCVHCSDQIGLPEKLIHVEAEKSGMVQALLALHRA